MEKTLEQDVYSKLKNNLVQCGVCAHACTIKPGNLGFCNSKKNVGGELYTLNYGAVTSMMVDFIERTPMFHFWPGTQTLGIACASCNFTCPWCINWEQSQNDVKNAPGVTYPSIEKIINYAAEWECKSISFTYTEPTIWYDFAIDVAKEAKKAGLATVLNTNGYMTTKIAEKFGPWIDAANVDIKSFSDDYYRKYCSAHLSPVLDAAKRLKKLGVHVEIANLILEGMNDDPKEIRQLAAWIRENLGADTPLIFERFFPHYRYFEKKEVTPTGILTNAYEVATREGLNYVYVWGLGPQSSKVVNTYCPECKKELVRRYYFEPFVSEDWKLVKKERSKA
jgi:pyruvate formate lyase activating enzyme